MSFSIPMSLPVDEDGFLRRECPHCAGQFKWRSSENAADESAFEKEMPSYFCPLCGEMAKADAWWTREQIEHATALVEAQVVAPMLDDFASDLQRLNRLGGSIQITTRSSRRAAPLPLPPEPNDMRLVKFSCHSDEPVKVPGEHKKSVYCLICGQTTSIQGDLQ